MTTCILFYKYTPLGSSDAMSEYAEIQRRFLTKLGLRGRLLIGYGDNEGLNGTFGGSAEAIESYVCAMGGASSSEGSSEGSSRTEATVQATVQAPFASAVAEFLAAVDRHFSSNGINHFKITRQEFKYSRTDQSVENVFPDLFLRVVPEIISTGGRFSTIGQGELGKGLLAPTDFHDELEKLGEEGMVIDCRNEKEVAIGTIPDSIDPHTRTFAEFGKWVDDNASTLRKKDKILMFCTGGIRCEKASAYVRRVTGNGKQEPTGNGKQQPLVYHLQGGVHKYLEEFGSGGKFKGKNFVFDQRQGIGIDENVETVGKCAYCDSPWDTFEPHHVCTVCREQLLLCPKCKDNLLEYHCLSHMHLRNCYFTNLKHFDVAALERQQSDLEGLYEEVRVGKRFRARRKTIAKQLGRVEERIEEIRELKLKGSGGSGGSGSSGDSDVPTANSALVCRSCGEPSSACNGSCWGFFGLNRSKKLKEDKKSVAKIRGGAAARPRPKKQTQQTKSTKPKKQRNENEIVITPPSRFYDSETKLRTPRPIFRSLSCQTKSRHCGKQLKSVIVEDFFACENEVTNLNAIESGLITVNGKITTPQYLLKNGDTIERLVHWHEPPVRLRRGQIDVNILECKVPEVGEGTLYVCDKPSTLPTHPGGPFYSNSLTCLVEAQENLPVHTLKPCHRLDRVTSGVCVCCTDPKIAKAVQKCMETGHVQKLYLACVEGDFPATEGDKGILVDKPIYTVDAKNGIRIVDERGKPSKTRLFKIGKCVDGKSLVACKPITGRGHQIRVHLQSLGYPIHGDTQYGGKALGSTEKYCKMALGAIIDSNVRSNVTEETNTDEKQLNAISLCPCCTEGPQASFSTAQLLGDGAEIELCAIRYDIDFSCCSKSTGGDANQENLEVNQNVVSVSVNLPPWSIAFGLDNYDFSELMT